MEINEEPSVQEMVGNNEPPHQEDSPDSNDEPMPNERSRKSRGGFRILKINVQIEIIFFSFSIEFRP